jgi:hypothetical protein
MEERLVSDTTQPNYLPPSVVYGPIADAYLEQYAAALATAYARYLDGDGRTDA